MHLGVLAPIYRLRNIKAEVGGHRLRDKNQKKSNPESQSGGLRS